MFRIIEEEALGEETLEEHKIIEGRPPEEDVEKTMGIVILIGVDRSRE